jgi:hypothetical protein
MDAALRAHLQQQMGELDAAPTRGPRLVDDAQRLWRRVQRFVCMGLVAASPEMDAIELACYAMQLPMQTTRLLPAGRTGRTSLRDRAEMSAELLVSTLGDRIEPSLLDRTTRLLHELPQRSPILEEARLLADAVNLDDYGIIGMLHQTIQAARAGEGIAQVADGCEKREQYGYWEARLKDSFHFEPVRQIAERRLANYRDAARRLSTELAEDQP